MVNQVNIDAPRDQSPVSGFRNMMNGPMRDEIAKQLPKGIDADRFIRTAITAVQMNPELLTADRNSLFGAIMQAAKDGLLTDGREAVIQIYNTNVAPKGQKKQWVKLAQYMPMVGGLIAKMYAAGCTYVDAAAVYEKDHFRFRRGDDACIEHEPYLGPENPGQVVAAYAIVKLGTGETKREVMPLRDILKVRSMSKAPDGAWEKWFDQLSIKAVLKRIYKQLPHTSADLDRIIEHDNEAMGFGDFRQQDPQETTAITGEATQAIEQKPAGRPSRLNSIINSTGIRDSGRQPVQNGAYADMQIQF